MVLLGKTLKGRSTKVRYKNYNKIIARWCRIEEKLKV
jgi:hypothetical protein